MKLARARWRTLHSDVRVGRPFPDLGADVFHATHHTDYRDHLRYTYAADTLLVIGSRHAFEHQAHEIRHLVEDCPAHMAKNPGAHCCAEIELGDSRRWARTSRRNSWSLLHIEYCTTHR